jgi:hypothetical protein
MWRDWLASARSDDEESPEAKRLRLRKWRRWFAVGAVGVLVASVGAVMAYRFGGRWLEERTRSRVGTYLEQQDYRRVQLTLEQAVQVSPHSLAARRALAEFYEVAGSPLAVARWQEAVNLAPHDDELRFRLAGVTLRLEGPAAARAALEGVSTEGWRTLGSQRLAAGIALAEANVGDLERALQAMTALEPENARTKIVLAGLRLRSPDPVLAAAARAQLEEIARAGTLRIHATLTLLSALPANPDAALRDLVVRIVPGTKLAPNTSGATALVEYLKAEKQPSAEDAAALAEWMTSRGLARDALVWVSTQPVSVQKAPAVLAARVAAAAQLRDWALLRQLLVEGSWGRLLPDAVELAFAARLQRERAGLENARATFSDAIEVAAPSPPTLKALDRLCALWGWPEESERVLTRLVHDYPREEAAWTQLLARAQAAGKSARYWELTRRRALAFPGDAAAQAARVYVAAITGQDDPDAAKAAQTALSRADAPAEEVAAGLLLRWRQRSAREALGTLTAVQIEKLTRSPRGALVYGAALAADGKDSREVLARVKVEALLPEEQALLSRSRAKGP